MGRSAVRTAIVDTLSNANLSYVGSIYASAPTILDEDAYTQTMFGQAVPTTGNGSSALIIVNLPGTDKRMRRADVGRGSVTDTNIHPVVLEIFFASSSGDAIVAQQDYDLIIDELIILIRENPTMSAPSTVWSAGEYQAGVTHDQGRPYSSADGLTIFIGGVVRFEAWEWIAGSGV